MAKTLAEDLKWRVIYLYSDGYSRKQIAKLLYIGKTLVNKIISIYAKWGCVVNPWRRPPGKKKVFSRSDMNVRMIYNFEELNSVKMYANIHVIY
jgi:transposase